MCIYKYKNISTCQSFLFTNECTNDCLKKQYQHLHYNSSDMLRCSHTIMASLHRNMSELF